MIEKSWPPMPHATPKAPKPPTGRNVITPIGLFFNLPEMTKDDPVVADGPATLTPIPTIGFCRDCRWWDGTVYEGKIDDYAECRNPKIKNQGSQCPLDGMAEADTNGYDPCLYSGPDFGCVQFERRES